MILALLSSAASVLSLEPDAIVADTAGSADQLYAGDLGATGSCTFAL